MATATGTVHSIPFIVKHVTNVHVYELLRANSEIGKQV